MQFFDVKLQPYRSRDPFSDYNDPLNNSDFTKNLCRSEAWVSRLKRKGRMRKGINGRIAVDAMIIKTENYET